MKKFLLLSVCLLVTMWAGATGTVSTGSSTTDVTITVDGDAGQIGVISESHDWGYVMAWATTVLTNDQGTISAATSLTVKGNINSADMKMLTKATGATVTSIDLSGATFVEPITTTFYEAGNLHLHSFMNETNTKLTKCTYVSLPVLAKSVEDTAIPKEFNLWCPEAETIIIPEGYGAIGEKAFMNRDSQHKLSNVQLPSSVLTIGQYAFSMQNISHIVLPNNLVSIDDEAFNQNLNLNAISFPASLTTLGHLVFSGDNLRDAYFLGNTAPTTVPADAFGATIQMGNNGYNLPKGNTANRSNYYNAGWICMLHYPMGLNDEQKATYVDPTRVYLGSYTDYNKLYDSAVGKEATANSLKSGDFTAFSTVNYGYYDESVGEDYVWPSQSQFTRAYVVAQLGLEWDGVTKLADKIDGAGARLGIYSFVFNSADVKPGQKTDEWDFDKLKNDQWWTLCVPFTMTKAQVTSVFGEGTEVCKFNKVVRDATNKVIKLYFTDNVYSDAQTGSTDVIVGHTAYMIYPTKSLADGKTYVFKNYTVDYGSVTATQVTAVDGVSSTTETSYKYNFIGNYLLTASNSSSTTDYVTIPQYSYFLGADDSGNHKYFFETGTTGKFNPYTAIVEPSDGKDDSFVASAKQLNSIFGEDADVTGIDKIEIIAGNENKVVGVYNLNGQKVSSTNSLEGLTKGLYIVNGKKYIVK